MRVDRNHPDPDALAELLARLVEVSRFDGLPPEDTPLGQTTRNFFRNNWKEARDGLLSKTTRIRLDPRPPSSAPHTFRFEIDLPYKRQVSSDAPVELVDGPIRGTIKYRPDVQVADPDEPSIVVLLDPDQALLHPNYSRELGVLCCGEIPGGLFPLEAFLEHLYSILSYENRSSTRPADLGAAFYFAVEPDAMAGLEDVEPLY